VNRIPYDNIADACRKRINDLYELSDEQIENEEIPYWYPKNVKLPGNADADFVDELFTKRALIAFSILHKFIQDIKDKTIRNLMLFTFS
jgi:hypothetical protein